VELNLQTEVTESNKLCSSEIIPMKIDKSNQQNEVIEGKVDELLQKEKEEQNLFNDRAKMVDDYLDGFFFFFF